MLRNIRTNSWVTTRMVLTKFHAYSSIPTWSMKNKQTGTKHPKYLLKTNQPNTDHRILFFGHRSKSHKSGSQANRKKKCKKYITKSWISIRRVLSIKNHANDGGVSHDLIWNVRAYDRIARAYASSTKRQWMKNKRKKKERSVTID